MLLICGGPSVERNISLNSARSVYDHLEGEFKIEIVFINKSLEFFLIDSKSLYSNTTSDFDFKLRTEGNKISKNDFLNKVRNHDIILPIMHGIFAEDGQIQKILESEGAAFIGSNSSVCNNLYNKKNADKFLVDNNYFTVPKMFIENFSEIDNIHNFFKLYDLKEAIVKPIRGGSSFGVKHAKSEEEAVFISKEMMNENDGILIEKRCRGREFTVIVIQNSNLDPIALIPTEIEVKDSDNIIFDTRRKYLSTNETHYYCPPRFSNKIISEIREETEKLFKLSRANDFLRIDGWLLDDGKIYFSDFNPISGMEQNSFIFQQASKISMTHKDILKYIVKSCANRNNVNITSQKMPIKFSGNKKKINVVFGGITAERQVSLLSGSNVWLKLLKKHQFDVSPFLLFEQENKFKILKLPYCMVLNHTVEEVLHQFEFNSDDYHSYANKIREELGLDKTEFEIPMCVSFEEFVQNCKRDDAYVFLALHGGFGENGDIQKILDENGLRYNGSRANASRLCINKFETGNVVNSSKIDDLRSAKKVFFKLEDLFDEKNLWKKLSEELGSKKILVKPNCDGSSSGVIVLSNEFDLQYYIELLKSNTKVIEGNRFDNQNSSVNMGNLSEILFEEFIETNKIEIINGQIEHHKTTGWIELTIGVLEKDGVYHALNPSITVSQIGAVLTLEEKFQGGTGINLTPPPEEIISKKLTESIIKKMELISQIVGIKDYCRIDIFANSLTNEIIIIEFNTLPALTPSTVIFQQAAREDMSPTEFIEKIIS